MAPNVGNFFARIFLGSLFNLALNFVLFAVGIYIAAKILNLENNSFSRAMAVSIIVFVVSLVPRMFFFIDGFFSMMIMFVVLIAAVKTVYKCEWVNALLSLIIATAIAALASIALSPVASYAIWG